MTSYRYAGDEDDPGLPVDLIRVRALMVPPGIPDFLTRTRLVEAGPTPLTGRAWAGRLGISRVEVSVDGGKTWMEAQLGEETAPCAWRAWSFTWDARPGNHTLCVRATDSQGEVQPVDQLWNLKGMGNNLVHRVDVIVE